MALAKGIILPDFDIVSGAVLEVWPAADQEVIIPPDVADLEQAKLFAAAAGERAGDGGQAVEPVVKEGPADRAASPASPGVGWLDARARRVGRQGDG